MIAQSPNAPVDLEAEIPCAALTPIEILELAKHESIIKRGMDVFKEVGTSLVAIRNGRLYRQGYPTFDEYCRQRWGMSRPHAYRLIEAAEVVRNLSPMGDILPANERQARPLTALEPEQQAEVWQQAVETAPNGKVTAAHVESVVNEFTAKPYRHVSDDSYEWYTPAEYIEAARVVMDGIDLDPASSDEAQKIVKAAAYYTKSDNGLVGTWAGRVWLNPPYCMPEVEQFTGRAIEDYESGKIDQAVILVNNATDTDWFHRLIEASGMVCFLNGRIKFYRPDGESASGARQGQAIFYLGKRAARFTKDFAAFGAVLVKAWAEGAEAR